MKRGFTLIELLVAVLIIGVLTAMALPMYQKSVDKSRYATLMPLAKNIKDAQEAFYLGGGKYSKDLGSLDVRVPGNPSGNTATLSDGTTVEISTTDGYGYVKLSKNNLNNNYIIYQDRSQNYPGEIHCEALTDSDRAQELCQNLGGTQISGSLTDGYTTYILSGTGAGIAPDLNQEAENHGNWQSCDTYPCTKACDRTVKTGYDCNGTYNEDGTYSEKVCQDNICVNTAYDEDGHKLQKTVCENDTESGTCRFQYEALYDAKGNMLSDRYCGMGYNNGNTCGGTQSGNEYSYDENGNKISWHTCEWDSAGNCSYGWSYEYQYDGNNNLILERYCNGQTSGENCQQVGSDYDTGYVYEDGQLISKYYCADAQCTSYRWEQKYDYGADGIVTETACYGADCSVSTKYLYENGNLLVKMACNDSGCPYAWEYVYENGNMVQERTCNSYDEASRSCLEYGSGDTYYTYDEAGHETSRRSCNNYDSNGECANWNICFATSRDGCMM